MFYNLQFSDCVSEEVGLKGGIDGREKGGGGEKEKREREKGKRKRNP